MEVKNFHCFVLGRCNENVVSKLHHRTDKVLMLRLHRKEVVSGRCRRYKRLFQDILLAALTTLRVTLAPLRILVIIAFGGARADVLIEFSILDML